MPAHLTPEKIDLMDRYLDHELSGPELEAFEKELASRPGMLRELREYTLFKHKLEFLTAPGEFPRKHADIPQAYRGSRSGVVKLLRVIAWLLIVLIFFVAYLAFSQYELFEVFFHPLKK